MHRTLSVVTLAGLLFVAPTFAVAQLASQTPTTGALASSKPPNTAKASKAKTKKAKAGKKTHATVGTVTSMDGSSLVIARAKKRGAMTFVLDTKTRRDNRIAVGSRVTVRYQNEGTSHVALAVASRPRA
jgi:hypothetical protein